MSCILKLKQIYNDLTDADRKIADYIFNNKDKVSKMSVSDLSTQSGTSAASIVRFSKKIGYDGFSDLKIELAKDVTNEQREYHYLNKDNIYDAENIMERIASKNIETINQTVVLNSESTIEKVVDEILKSNNIYIFGVGGSALVALDFQFKLLRINKPTFASLDSHVQLMISSNLSKNDLAIGISYSGSSIEVIKSMENASKKGAKCISITKYGENALNKICDLNLFVPNIEKKLREGAISSRIATLTLVDTIYISMIQKNLNNAEIKLKETRQILDYLNGE